MFENVLSIIERLNLGRKTTNILLTLSIIGLGYFVKHEHDVKVIERAKQQQRLERIEQQIANIPQMIRVNDSIRHSRLRKEFEKKQDETMQKVKKSLYLLDKRNYEYNLLMIDMQDKVRDIKENSY